MQSRLPLLLVACGTFVFASFETVHAQKKGKNDPPEAFQPNETEWEQIKAKTARLAARIAELRKDPKTHELLPDVEIYLRGAENIVRFKEFYSKESVKWTLDSLDRGMQRAEQLAKGETPWTQLKTRNVLRAYRSIIDGTAQPYGVTYPLDYGKDRTRRWRGDIVLHGRNSTLTEVSFLNAHNGAKQVVADQDWVQIDIFGRGNNAYRWAGESDVYEAMFAFYESEAAQDRRENVPLGRFVLRGFSMGGAGTWHLGLHNPTIWSVMGPGAGFTTTHGYAWPGTKDLPDYQEKCLRIYDAIDYAENARMIPIVAYSGGDDPQKKAADNIENRLKELKIDGMTHLVAPGLGHTFPAEWFKKANGLWSKHSKSFLSQSQAEAVTYTTKYWSFNRIAINALEKHYEKATVKAELGNTKFRITTKNVRALSLTVSGGNIIPPPGPELVHEIDIDGDKVKEPIDFKRPTQHDLYFVRDAGKWKTISYQDLMARWMLHPQKVPLLQGPIDDAFAYPFVCVLGSGETWHPATQKFVDAKVSAFKYDWAKHWRGELPTTGDYAVTPSDIMDKHLILFGDPQSNMTLAQILPRLPLKWTKDEIEFDGKKYNSSDHVPVMIFPNPLNPSKYVVLNTGPTIPSEDYAKTNALLFPRLGDYALLRMTPTTKNAAAFEVATAGLFNDSWQVEKK